MHVKDKSILEDIKNYLGVGRIFKHGSEFIQYRVESIKEIAIICEHFNKYFLITEKQADFELFKKAFDLQLNKLHLTPEGLKKIVAIKASLNLGLSENLIGAFPNLALVERPLIHNQRIQDPA